MAGNRWDDLLLADLDPAGEVPKKMRSRGGRAAAAVASASSVPADLPPIGERVKRATAYLGRMDPGIQGEKGSGPTYTAARAMVRGFCLDHETALGLMLAHYNPRCVPPWTVGELEHKLRDAATKPFGQEDGYLARRKVGKSPAAITPAGAAGPPAPSPPPLSPSGEQATSSAAPAGDPEPAAGEGKRSAADLIVDYAIAAGIRLFHEHDQTAWAGVPVFGPGDPVTDDRGEVVPAYFDNRKVRSPGFKSWLTLTYYRAEGKAATGEALSNAANTLETLARCEGPERVVHLRTAPLPDGGFAFDLCDDQRRAVVVTAAGWAVTSAPPVVFGRGPHMKPLPVPVGGGTLAPLWSFVNVKTDDDRLLLLTWLTAAMRPDGPYPILHLKGEPGTAKTTAGELIREMMDPHTSNLRSEPEDVRDLAIASRGGWLFAYDNLSHVPEWLSDALCRVATGGGFATRALYTDDEEAVFAFRRPVLMTSVTDVIGKPDLLDRSLAVELVRIGDGNRRTLKALTDAFAAARPALLGAVLDVAVRATAILEAVRAENRPTPRMADFAVWGEAVSRAVGNDAGKFIAVLNTVRAQADQMALESSPLALAVYQFAKDRVTWTGTCTNLLAEVNAQVDAETRRLRCWPSNANSLGGKLKIIAQPLARIGVDVWSHRNGKDRTRVVSLSYRRTTADKADEADNQTDGTLSALNGLEGQGLASEADKADNKLLPLGSVEKKELQKSGEL